MRRIKAVTAAVICLLMLTACSNVPKVKIVPDGNMSGSFTKVNDAVQAIPLDGYEAAATNERLTLYYENNGLTIAVRDNSTGNVMYSAATPDEESSDAWRNFVNSGVVVDYYKGKATVVNRVNMYSGKPQVSVYKVKNGFAADINFTAVGFKLTVCVTLTQDGIEVCVPSASVVESNDNFRLAAIWLFPFLGYTHLGDTAGYMFVPDGCGALISLNDKNGKYNQPYKAAVYGYDYSVVENTAVAQEFEEQVSTVSDTSSVSAPVFGMVHTDKGMGILGIVENGNTNCEIYAYPNGVITDYNWVTSRYVYRQIYLYPTSQTSGISSYETKRADFDIKTRYIFVSGDDADYVGLAKAYRKYLEDGGTVKRSENEKEPIRLDFFAGDVQKALIGNSFVPMTTVSQADKILEKLQKGGVSSAAVTYKGWQKNGIYGNISSVAFDGSLGKLKDYLSLKDKYKNMSFSLYADVLNVYGKSNDVMYRYNGKIFSDDTEYEIHKTLYRLLPERSFEILDMFSKNKIPLVVDGITDELYSHSVNSKEDLYTRKHTAEDIAGKLSKAESFAYVSPNDYLYNTANRYYDFALYGSNYKFVDREVPFFAIALKGSITLYSEYVNFKADSKEYLLKMIESGIYPSFLLTSESPDGLIYTDSANLYSTDFGEYKKVVLSDYKIFSDLKKLTEGAVIKDHIREGDICITRYSNGASVYVNYSKSQETVDGVTVKPLDFVFKAGVSK